MRIVKQASSFSINRSSPYIRVSRHQTSVRICRLCGRCHNDLTGLFQTGRTGTAHIQVIADDKTVVAHHSPAKGANVEMLDRFAKGMFLGLCEFPLVKRFCDNAFGFRKRLLTRFGKTDRCASPLTSALFANQRKTEFFAV